MLNLFQKCKDADLTRSILFDNRTFYPAFLKDMDRCKRELIIECPFITQARMNALYPSFRRLTNRGVRVVINTRQPKEHEYRMAVEAEDAISLLHKMGVLVLFTERHHRKLAIIDREILYEGSLNILSQKASCKIMRRIKSRIAATEVIKFTQLSEFLQ